MPPFFRSKLRIALSSCIILAVLGGAVFLLRPYRECKAERPAAPPAGKAASSAPRPVSVRTIKIEPERFLVPVPATGTLVPRETVTLVSELSRRLSAIYVEEGQEVKKGALLFELDTSELLAERKRLDVQLELAKKTAARQRELVRAQVGTEAEAEVAETSVDELLASRRILDVTLSKAQIRAPFAGVLGLRKVSVGSWVTSATPLITLSDTSELKIDFRVPERHAPSIRVGSTFQVSIEGQKQTFSGTVIATEPSVDVESRSLAVRGVVAGAGLVPGTFAKVELPVTIEAALLVPNIAIVAGVQGRAVYVVENNQAKLKPVQLGERTPERVQVLSGLRPGQHVVTSNLLRIQDGTPVAIEGSQP